MPSLTEIAENILKRAKLLDTHLAETGLPSPHFFYDTLTHLPDHLQEERNALVNEAQDLKRLAMGPVAMMLETLFTVSGS
jgi:hypothetical protein